MSRAVPVFLFVFVFGGWFVLDYQFTRLSIPGPEIDTFDEWIKWHPQAEQFVELTSATPRLLALGPPVGFSTSGPSAYVFDGSGALLARTLDLGDDPDFIREWEIVIPLDFVDHAAARIWMQEHQPGSPAPPNDLSAQESPTSP